MHRVSVFDAFAFGIRAFRADPLSYAARIGVIVAFLLIVVSLIGDSLSAMGLQSGIGMLIVASAGAVAQLAYTRLALTALRERVAAWDELWLPRAFPSIIVYAVFQSVLFSAPSPLLLTLAFILAVLLAFVPFLVVERGSTLIDAARESIRLVAPRAGTVALLLIASAFLNLAGLIALGVGVLVSLPITLIATAHVYQSIVHEERSSTKPHA
ncbi:hypothetical protein KGO06_02065 [Patescibacteria group bacterium]|nr:hypothetical protein [Patescibacteria group bacterium]